MNDYDARRMVDLLHASHGLRLVQTPEQADMIILNTCHIREKAEEKLFSELGRLHKTVRAARRSAKDQGQAGQGQEYIFAVGGCVAQATGTEIFRRAPFVQLVFGPQTYHRLPAMLDQLQHQGGHICATDVAFPVEETNTATNTETPATAVMPASKFDTLPQSSSRGPMASVTVQEGCNKLCAFCVVPFTRGQEWSRPVADIVAEASGLVQQGALEIQLLGQNVNAYQGADHDGIMHDLPMLIRRVALLPGVERIRFVTSHPGDMSDDLLEVFANVPQLCPYFHLPVQSGSDRILAQMGRGHTVEEYRQWVVRLREVCPDIALASDFIVGFPGESDHDFQDTLDLVESVGFDHAYSFCFSPRPGTQAAEMGGHIPLKESQARLATLQEALNAQQLIRNRLQVGRRELVLVEGLAKKGQGEVTGRTPGFRKVNFPGSATMIGHVVSVEITEGLPNSLRGRLTTTF